MRRPTENLAYAQTRVAEMSPNWRDANRRPMTVNEERVGSAR